MANRIVKIDTKGDELIGYLSFIEFDKEEIDFQVKRIYYTYDVPLGTKRGMHAHKKLQQLMWCPYGEIEVILDNGLTKESYILNKANEALLVESGYWRDMYWRQEGSVLCVAASEYYDENDYIRDYDEFLKYVAEGYWKNED